MDQSRASLKDPGCPSETKPTICNVAVLFIGVQFVAAFQRIMLVKAT